MESDLKIHWFWLVAFFFLFTSFPWLPFVGFALWVIACVIFTLIEG